MTRSVLDREQAQLCLAGSANHLSAVTAQGHGIKRKYPVLWPRSRRRIRTDDLRVTRQAFSLPGLSRVVPAVELCVGESTDVGLPQSRPCPCLLGDSMSIL